jgi:hypothetical protein
VSSGSTRLDGFKEKLFTALTSLILLSYNTMTEAVDEHPPTSNPIINGNPFSLENILGENHDALEHPGTNGVSAAGWDEDTPENAAPEGYCIECEGMQRPAIFFLRYSQNHHHRPACSSCLRNVFRHVLRSLLRSSTPKRIKEATCCKNLGWPEGEETENEWLGGTSMLHVFFTLAIDWIPVALVDGSGNR